MLIWPIIFAGLTILQPDMGTTVLIFGFSFVLIYLAGFDGKFFGGAFAIAGFLGFIAARMSPLSLGTDSVFGSTLGLMLKIWAIKRCKAFWP